MRNYIIVGTQRTGSSALGEAVSLHPDVLCGWEWMPGVVSYSRIALAKRGLKGDFSALNELNREHMESVYKENAEWLGFRCLFRSSAKWLIHPRFSPALYVDQFVPYLKWMAHEKDLHIIHIVRRDNLSWLRSKTMSKATGLYVGAQYPENLKEYIDPGEAVKRLVSKNWVDQNLASLSLSNPYKRVIYEEFRSDNDGMAHDILDFLGCANVQLNQVSRKLKPQSSARVEDSISNYNEIYDLLVKRGLLESNI